MRTIYDPRLEEGTEQNKTYKKQLRSMSKWQEEIYNRETLIKSERPNADLYSAEWTMVKGVMVYRVENSKYVAAPCNENKKSSKVFHIIDLEEGKEVCQLKKREVNAWLISARKREVEVF